MVVVVVVLLRCDVVAKVAVWWRGGMKSAREAVCIYVAVDPTFFQWQSRPRRGRREKEGATERLFVVGEGAFKRKERLTG